MFLPTYGLSEQDLQRTSREAAILDGLDCTSSPGDSFPLGEPRNNFWELDLVAVAFPQPGYLCVSWGRTPAYTPTGGYGAHPVRGCLASRSFRQLHPLAGPWLEEWLHHVGADYQT